MLFLPEASAFLGETSQETVAQAQELDTSTVVERFRDLAKEHSLNMSFCLHEAAGGDKAYNTQVVLDERGEIKARYRKVHLFDVDVPRGPVLKESRYTVGGTDLVSCDVGGSFVLGLTTCYDLRFPEMYQALRYCHGVNLFSVPSAFTKPTGQAGHWSTLLRARAIENQSYIVASAQAGRHSERRESFGHSMIIDPRGVVVAELGPEETDIAICDLDPKLVESVRQRMPIDQHREVGRAALGWDKK